MNESGHRISELVNKPIGFNTETGEPIYATKSEDNNQRKPEKNRFVIILLIAAGVVACVIGLAFYAFKSGLFMGNREKVLLAVVNTISDTSHLSADMIGGERIDTDQYTIDFKGIVNDTKTNILFTTTPEVQQLYAYDENTKREDYTCALELTKEQLTLAINGLEKQCVYHYTQEPGIALKEAFSEDTIKEFNNILCRINNLFSNQNDSKDTIQIGSEDALSMLLGDRLEKVPAKSYTVDKKNRYCTGYRTTNSKENSSLLDLTMAEGSKVGKTLSTTYYLYKGKLACMEFVTENADIEIQFRGGNYRCENMALVINGEKRLELKGATKENTETMECFLDGMSIFQTEYNFETKKLHLDANYSIGLTADIIFLPSEDGMAFEIKNMTSLYTNTTINGQIHISKEAKLLKLTNEEFDIGKASAEEVMLLKQAVSVILGGITLYS